MFLEAKKFEKHEFFEQGKEATKPWTQSLPLASKQTQETWIQCFTSKRMVKNMKSFFYKKKTQKIMNLILARKKGKKNELNSLQKKAHVFVNFLACKNVNSWFFAKTFKSCYYFFIVKN